MSEHPSHKVRLGWTKAQLGMFLPAEPKRWNVFPCGRRFGKTYGAMNACVWWGLNDMPILWGDTVHANIDKYVDRLFKPTLHTNGIDYEWKQDKKVLTIAGRGYVDFQSAQYPENWEGFGYRRVVLNEAGIILKNPDLFYKTVLPMTMEYPDCEVHAIGVPKGKELKNGREHPFYSMWKQVPSRTHRGAQYSSYDNNMRRKEDIDELVREMAHMDPLTVRQEIYGEFIDRVAGNPFAHAFGDQHIAQTTRRPIDVHYVSVDFNVDPFCAIIGHIWEDRQGPHLHITHEISIKEGTVRAMAQRILQVCPHRHLIQLTGDRNGRSRRIGTTDNMPLFEELRRELGIGVRQVLVLPNPTHLYSREEVNFCLVEHPDLKIDPTCTGLIRDLRSVEIDGDGRIVKDDRSQADKQADLLDCFRYLLHTRLATWIKRRRNELHRHPNGLRSQPLPPVRPSRSFELGSGSGIV